MFPIVLLALYAATVQPGMPASFKGWRPDQIRWEAAAPNGTKFALLEGERDKAGVGFSYAFAVPGGVWDGPHSHSATVKVFVAKGALRIGFGPVPDHGKAITYPAGSYLIVPAGAVHFDGADEDTVIIGAAVGPWTTTYLDGSAPASAGTPLPR